MSWSVSQFIKTSFRSLSHFGVAPLTVWVSEIFPSVQRWLLEDWRSNGVKRTLISHAITLINWTISVLCKKCCFTALAWYCWWLTVSTSSGVPTSLCILSLFKALLDYKLYFYSEITLRSTSSLWMPHGVSHTKHRTSVECVSMVLVKWEMHPRQALKVFDTDTGSRNKWDQD